ncbi:hypothetical protein P3U44_11225 [Mammaliicoccus sciuri]|uniref:hypothetical protein n=1 Tax=Mammaliicoccus sciuri TaxID=1296 RepID=UPI002B259664|nr:hypothetical protein [Mammaliicoccus sciuri]WQJ73420.1 hypothetical protein P3U44_11225 [Mammaliicoccus sciuri]
MFTQNLKKYMKQQEKQEQLNKERREARELIEEQKRDIIRPTHEELLLFDTLIKELQRLNKITFEVSNLLDDLEQRQDYIVPSAYNLEFNTLQQRLDNTNYQAHEIKKQIKNKLRKFYEFTGRIPEVIGGKVYREYTYEYNRVDRRIQNVFESIQSEQSYGEYIATEYKRKFNGMMPKEFS